MTATKMTGHEQKYNILMFGDESWGKYVTSGLKCSRRDAREKDVRALKSV